MQNAKEYKTSEQYREKVNEYKNKIRSDPDKYKKMIEYHKNYYKKMKDALQKIKQQEHMNINTHEIIMDY